jgi:hypothetical protein
VPERFRQKIGKGAVHRDGQRDVGVLEIGGQPVTPVGKLAFLL